MKKIHRPSSWSGGRPVAGRTTPRSHTGTAEVLLVRMGAVLVERFRVHPRLAVRREMERLHNQARVRSRTLYSTINCLCMYEQPCFELGVCWEMWPDPRQSAHRR